MQKRAEDFGFYDGIDRRCTHSLKWDRAPEGVLPLWVADMDFPCAPAIVKALKERAAHPAYGYTNFGEENYAATMGYYARRHGWQIQKEQLLFTPGVVDSLYLSVQALTAPGDGVLIQPPVYGPFFSVIRKSQGRRIVENPLVFTGDDWRMDLDDLDKKLASCRLMLLCSPHNPSGRVWPQDTLQRVLALCKKHNVYLMVDEIHCDFVYSGFRHTPILTLPGSESGVAAAVSATKSYNIAGLKHSTLVVPDEKMRGLLSQKADEMNMRGGNLFAVCATAAAYTGCDGWMDALLYVLEQNRDLAVRRLNAMGFPTLPPQGTYLLFTDMRKLAKTSDEIYDLLLNKAKVLLNKGTEFGPLGEGFMRLNLACPPALLNDALDRIEGIL